MSLPPKLEGGMDRGYSGFTRRGKKAKHYTVRAQLWEALVGTGWAISFLLFMNELRLESCLLALWGPHF